MKPIRTPHTTLTLGAPAGWDETTHGPCGGLPVCRDHDTFFSYWRATWRERLAILFGRPVRLGVMNERHPVVSMDTAEH